MNPLLYVTLIQSLLHVFYCQLLLSTNTCVWCFLTDESLFSISSGCLSALYCSMWRLLAGFVLLLCAADAAPVDGKTAPDFGEMYHVKGELTLPYSGDKLKESFEVWYDLEGNRSRIDYRDSTVRTFLIGNDFDYGAIYQITPVTTETEIQAIKYFQLNGTKEDPIRPQAALPDLQGFEFEKMEDYAGVQCEVWRKVTQAGHKKNTYRLWVTRPEGSESPAVPYHFEMMGFNTLLESHNDKYMIDYSDFSPKTESDIFTPPRETYEKFPDPSEEHQILANPLQDYVHTSPVSHAHRLFGPFKEKFERQYANEKEHEERESYFVHTLRRVHSMNRAGLTYSLGINHFADRSKAELARMTGGLLIPDKKKAVTK